MFETAIPAFVELFGHNQIAGMVSTHVIGGSALLRVDVPEVDANPGFTKFYGVSAIYAITPTDEATMLLAVKKLRAKPIETYRLQLPETVRVVEDDDDYGDEDPNDFRYEDR